MVKLVMLGVVVGAAFVGGAQYAAHASRTFAQLELFSEVLSKVQTTYVDEPDTESLIVGAISGMMSELDPHSEYMPPRDFTEMRVQTSGEFGGLGIEITMRDGFLTVVSPIEDTPAFRAGMQANDKIVAVDGKSIKGFGLTESVDLLRGKVGSEVVIKVVRGEDNPFDLKIVRDKIVVKSVKSEFGDDKIGIVKITQFKSRTTEELLKALDAIMEQEPIGLVLDLRNNPGGLLDQAVGVSDAFLTEGKIVYTEGRTQESQMSFSARDDGMEPKVPLVVLVNGGSASASEIVAGALKDHKRALVVGTRSFGKGSVQTILPLSNRGGLRVTTALYFTPSGTSIQAEGIVPDVEVEAFPGSSKLMYREENIDGHFENIQRDGSENVSKEDLERRLEKQREMIQAFREGKLADEQIKRAKELIKSIEIFGPTLRGTVQQKITDTTTK